MKSVMPPRKYVDLSTLTMDGQKLPAVYVKSEIIRQNNEPAFHPYIKELEDAPYPGFFLTNSKGDFDIRVRWCLNRHGIWKSDIFYDSNGMLHRDIDVKGIGYTRNYPIRFLSVRLPEMSGDMEMRGVLHNDVATGDLEITEELEELGIRVAKHMAHIELFEMVNQKGEKAPRDYFNNVCYLDFDKVRPTIAFRAMGTTSRVWDLRVSDKTHNGEYVKEIIDDAIGLVSTEVGDELSPSDYVIWFVENMGRQLGKMHKNSIWTDFMAQIHGGLHNLTLDCRLTDTYHYQSPKKARKEYMELKEMASKDPIYESLLEEMFPSDMTKEQAKESNREGEERDRHFHESAANRFATGINEIYPIGNLLDEINGRFLESYKSERL